MMPNSSRVNHSEYETLATKLHMSRVAICSGKGTFKNISDLAQGFTIGMVVKADGSFDDALRAIERARLRYERHKRAGFDGEGLIAVRKACLDFEEVLRTTKKTELHRAIERLRKMDNVHLSVRKASAKAKVVIPPPVAKKPIMKAFETAFLPIDGFLRVYK